MDELEVYITPDGLGRAGIARRGDGLLCIYTHWKWREFTPPSWLDDDTPLSVLTEDIGYGEQSPESGLYGTLDDARRNLRSMRGFADAILKLRT